MAVPECHRRSRNRGSDPWTWIYANHQRNPFKSAAEAAGIMEVYVYDTPNGKIADFRSYLTGTDHSFEEGRPMGGYDARWEKVQTLLCPRTDASLFGSLEYLGKGAIDDYHELMIFPISYDGEVIGEMAASDSEG